MTKEKKVSEIIEKIRKEEIKPTPKWQCQLINGAFWLTVAIAIFLSSVFFSFLLMGLFEMPIEIFRELGWGDYLKVIFQVIPYLWLILVFMSVFLGVMALKKTRFGYRYEFAVVIGVAMVLILFIGLFLRQTRFGAPIIDRMPHYFNRGPFNKSQEALFVEDGLLGGEVVDFKKDKVYIINRLGEKWEVLIGPETQIKKRAELFEGDKVLIIGEKEKPLVFRAFVIKKIEHCLGCGNPTMRPGHLEPIHHYESEYEED